MSEDLGRFVAAAIRDRALEEVMQENERLRAELARVNNCYSLRVTGPGGFPVYAEMRLKWMGCYEYDFEISKCKITDIESAEFRVGNDYVLKFADGVKTTSEFYDEENGREFSFVGHVYFWNVDGKKFFVGWRPEIIAGSDGEETAPTYVEFGTISWVPNDENEREVSI